MYVVKQPFLYAEDGINSRLLVVGETLPFPADIIDGLEKADLIEAVKLDEQAEKVVAEQAAAEGAAKEAADKAAAEAAAREAAGPPAAETSGRSKRGK